MSYPIITSFGTPVITIFTLSLHLFGKDKPGFITHDLLCHAVSSMNRELNDVSAILNLAKLYPGNRFFTRFRMTKIVDTTLV